MNDVPKVGKGSPRGPRWFLTGAHELQMTMDAEDSIVGPGGIITRKRGKRILFTKQRKPRVFISRSHELNSDNPTGLDRNASEFWGVFKTDDQKVIDFLRNHEHFMYEQRNEAINVKKMQIVELDWDPGKLPAGPGNEVKGLAKPDAPGTESPEPEESRAARQGARVADMTGKK